MRVATIVGNRPQFVKAAAVSKVLRRDQEEILIHTGQHYDDEMSRIFFEQLELPAPDHQLGAGRGTNSGQTARMIAALEGVLEQARPDLVLVYGDTNTTLAGAIVAAQRRLRLAHVEAGMRSFDRAMPEELNRVLTDHASDLLLCSTSTAVSNLEAEGISDGVHLVGDVMADVALASIEAAEQSSKVLAEQALADGDFLLVTAHRAGNVDTAARLALLVGLLEALPMQTVFPVHPRTRSRLEDFGLLARLKQAPHVRLLGPLGYLDLLVLARHARAVLTDSGGLQKEAYLLGTPCITLRDRTEWVETVEAGWNVLVDLDAGAAVAALQSEPPAGRPELYGDGHAAERIGELVKAA